jgi:hypothetical protein
MRIKESHQRVIDAKTLAPYLIKEIVIDDSKTTLSILTHGKNSFDELCNRLSIRTRVAKRDGGSLTFEYQANASQHSITFTGNLAHATVVLSNLDAMSQHTKELCLKALDVKQEHISRNTI